MKQSHLRTLFPVITICCSTELYVLEYANEMWVKECNMIRVTELTNKLRGTEPS